MIDRRTFVRTAVGLFAAPLAARAQPAPRIRRIGLLTPGPAPTAEEDQAAKARLRELGWIEGRNLAVEGRFANGRIELLRPYAEELVRLKVDVIVTFGTESAFAAKNATATIPIVMGAVGDPVGSGLVASLAHPGGNITGYSVLAPELAVKRAALLHEVLPAVRRVAVMVNPNNRITGDLRKRTDEAYRSLGLQPIFIEVTTAQHYLDAPAEAARRGAQALEIGIDPDSRDVAGPLMQSVIAHRLPTIVADRDLLELGGLISFDLNADDQDRRVLAIVDKVLRGAKPADIPIEQPTKFVLAINMKAAKALGIAIPKSVLLRADEVIR